MSSTDVRIHDVSDTSLWVAYYRAEESERPDALFHDPLAKILVGERGPAIAQHMKTIGRYTKSNVVLRTVIIDEYIQTLISEGIDTVINLGAGLDTRPYRMKLPKNFRWIEVDYPHIVALKNERLKSETPTCQLSRVELDLSDDEKRRKFLAEAAAQTSKALIITEGVIPYLTLEQVTKLANELHQLPSFAYWITEFMDPAVYKYLKSRVRTRQMKNAPFRFYPEDWMGFFKKLGWVEKEIRYLGEEAIKQGRGFPMPWWAMIFRFFMSAETKKKAMKMTGYLLLQKSK